MLFILQTGNKVVPSSLAREELGHKPRPIEETIYDTIEFFQKRSRKVIIDLQYVCE